jgi:hypothetical protein
MRQRRFQSLIFKPIIRQCRFQPLIFLPIIRQNRFLIDHSTMSVPVPHFLTDHSTMSSCPLFFNRSDNCWFQPLIFNRSFDNVDNVVTPHPPWFTFTEGRVGGAGAGLFDPIQYIQCCNNPGRGWREDALFRFQEAVGSLANFLF